MKKITTLILFITISMSVNAQEEIADYFFDEIHLSVNSTVGNGDDSKGRIGWGLGIYHSFFKQNPVNLVVGFDYNKSNRVKQSITDIHGAVYTDCNVGISALTVPVVVRYNHSLGEPDKKGRNKPSLILELGFYVGPVWYDRLEGTTVDPLTNEAVTETMEYAPLVPFQTGLNVGGGIRIPYKGVDLLYKLDYQFGLTEMYKYGTVIKDRYVRLTVGVNINPHRKEIAEK